MQPVRTLAPRPTDHPEIIPGAQLTELTRPGIVMDETEPIAGVTVSIESKVISASAAAQDVENQALAKDRGPRDAQVVDKSEVATNMGVSAASSVDDQALLRSFIAGLGTPDLVISGGTGTGKTTFLNALLKEVPQGDRLIVIEDTPEVKLAHPNAVGLIAVNSELGEARVGIDELLRASLRMRPDRLMVGEIRGAEAFTFLRAVNTGHPGSLTTVHADSPQGAMDQIAFMTLQAGLTLTRADVIDYARSVIDVVVQLSRVSGKRGVSQVVFHRRT